jgi:type II secretion system protein J
MRVRAHTTKRRTAAGFTLIEMLVASTIFLLLAAAIYAVFSSALKLRERAYATIERELPAAAVLGIMRRDLAGMVIPNGTLAGPMLGTANRTGATSQDTLQFFTTTGRLDENSDDPWAEIQEVNYCLIRMGTGLELVREVTRNLLSPTLPEPNQQRLLAGVQGLQFEYLNDQTWLDGWDSEANGQTAPAAVKVRIDLAPGGENDSAPQPVEMICEIAEANTSTTATTPTGLAP